MRELTDADFDRLALDFAEIIGFVSGATVDYDVAGYDRCVRIEAPPESLPVRDILSEGGKSRPSQADFIEESYLVRLAGFRRQNIFGPDEIGELLQRKGIAWSDGLGNGLYESLAICRKYGLGHVLEAPILGFPRPFLETEWETFREVYPKYVARFITDLMNMEPIYGGGFTGESLKLIVLWEADYPLAHFIRAYRREPAEVNREMAEAIGMPELPVIPQTPVERIGLIKFWNWVREKQSRVAEIEAEVLREMLGPKTIVMANPHELPVLDFEGQSRAFELPAVAVRPLMLDDDLMLRHYIAYYVQLYHDLTEKAPMVSVRMNLSASSPKYVPTGTLMRTWYDQAVRHGGSSFYFWTRDYPPDDDPNTYDGPIPGNPIESTLPRERWEASLDILGHLATHQRFQQPDAEVSILVPTDSALLDRAGWRRIYTAFSALAERRVFAQFISDRQIESRGLPSNLKLVIAPELEFISPGLRAALEAFTHAGGRLLVPDGALFDRQGTAVAPLEGAAPVLRGLYDAFPLGSPGDADQHQVVEDFLIEQAKAVGVDPQRWVFDICCENLPPADHTWLREADPQVYFAPWLYEHGSEWIMPYLKDL